MRNFNLFNNLIRLHASYQKIKLQRKQDHESASLYIKYKISNSYEDYQKTGKLLIQSRKGSAYCYLTPEEICSDDDFLSQMHPIDVNIVTKLHLKKEPKQLKLSIIRQKILSTKEVIYTIYDASTGEQFEISKKILLNSNHILNKLNAKDCMSIGFDLGVQHGKTIFDLAK